MTACFDCGLEYGGAGWMDAIVSDDIWRHIAPRDDGGGILCITCIAKRCEQRGLKDVAVSIRSGSLICGDVVSVQPLVVKAYEDTECPPIHYFNCSVKKTLKRM